MPLLSPVVLALALTASFALQPSPSVRSIPIRVAGVQTEGVFHPCFSHSHVLDLSPSLETSALRTDEVFHRSKAASHVLHTPARLPIESTPKRKPSLAVASRIKTRISRTPEQEMEHVTVAGSILNIALAGMKTFVGLTTRSPAMVADAAHSLSDLLSDAITLWAVKLGARRSDAVMPFGYGKYEAIGSIGVAIFLTVGVVGVAVNSAQALRAMLQTGAVMAVSGPRLAGVVAALATAAISIASKEILARWTERVAIKYNSLPLKVNAVHHRSDALSSVIALFGIAGALVGFPCLDPISGLAVAVLIGKMTVGVWREAFMTLVDAADAKATEEVTRCLESQEWPEHIEHFSDIRVRRMGNKFHVDFWAVLRDQPERSITDFSTRNGQWISARAALKSVEKIRSYLRKAMPDVSDVTVQLRYPSQAESRSSSSTSKLIYS